MNSKDNPLPGGDWLFGMLAGGLTALALPGMLSGAAWTKKKEKTMTSMEKAALGFVAELCKKLTEADDEIKKLREKYVALKDKEDVWKIRETALLEEASKLRARVGELEASARKAKVR